MRIKISNRHLRVLFSSSRDGDLLADFAQKAGVIAAHGSSTREGKGGSKRLIEFFNTERVRHADLHKVNFGFWESV